MTLTSVEQNKNYDKKKDRPSTYPICYFPFSDPDNLVPTACRAESQRSGTRSA